MGDSEGEGGGGVEGEDRQTLEDLSAISGLKWRTKVRPVRRLPSSADPATKPTASAVYRSDRGFTSPDAFAYTNHATPRLQLHTAQTLLTGFFARRELVEPDERPLYRYRTLSREFEDLGEVSSYELRKHRIGPKGAMAFCLWASEWWRQNYEAGPWKWEPLLAAVGHTEFAPGGSRYGDLQDLVIRGLCGWRRSILRVGASRGFLVTLACEGGLPLRLVLRQQTHLRAYLKGVLEEFKLFGTTGIPPRDLAERVQHRLPKGLRQQVVYELSGDLIKEIWQLQQTLGDTSTPVKDLDRTHPGWRNQLPVRVPDSVARTLLNGLLRDAVEVARGARIRLRWNVELVGVRGGEWEFRGSFQLPGTIGADGFNRLFGREPDAEVPDRFDLSYQTDAEKFCPLALATPRRTDRPGRHFGLEPLPAALIVHTSGLTRPRELVARTTDNAFSTNLFPGAAGLVDLPWVFVAKDVGEGARPVCRLAGQGSVKVGEQSAFVAVDAGATIEGRDDGVAELVGSARNEGGRLVYRVKGRVLFRASDGSWSVVETRAVSGTANTEYRLHGTERRFGRGAIPMFLGSPTMQEWRDGDFQGVVSERHLLWKSDGPGGKWQPYSSTAVDSGLIRGSGVLRYVRDDIVRHSIRTCILPEHADIRIRPTEDPSHGEILFLGFGRVTASVAQPSGITVTDTDDYEGYRLELEAHDPIPDEITVVVDWEGRGRVSIELPFPARRVGFVAADGRPLENETNLAEGSLAGVRSEVIVPRDADFEVQGQYIGPDASEVGRHRAMFVREIRPTSPGHYALDLAMVQPAIAERLAASNHRDGAVRLLIASNQLSGSIMPTKITVSRFDISLERRNDNLSLLGLDPPSQLQISLEDLVSLKMEALPLLNPDQDPVPLQRCVSDAWRVPEGTMEPGPHLILGRQGDWQRVRPMTWYVGRKDDVVASSSELKTVADAYSRGLSGEKGIEPFRRVARELAGDPTHDDWSLVFGYLRQIALPVRVFPMLQALAEDPATCAMAAVRASAREFELLWERTDTFSFAWWQIPLASWEHAFGTYARGLEADLAAMGAEDMADSLFTDAVSSPIERVTERLEGLAPALGFLCARLTGEQVPSQVSRITNPQMLDMLQQQYARHQYSGPAQLMGLGDIPELPGLSRRIDDVKTEHPWSSSVFIKRMGPFEVRPRADFADAPAFTAATVVAGDGIPKQLARAIREARTHDRSWFDDALRLAQWIAFGRQQADNIDRQLGES